jgi:hypothetical protein
MYTTWRVGQEKNEQGACNGEGCDQAGYTSFKRWASRNHQSASCVPWFALWRCRQTHRLWGATSGRQKPWLKRRQVSARPAIASLSHTNAGPHGPLKPNSTPPPFHSVKIPLLAVATSNTQSREIFRLNV